MDTSYLWDKEPPNPITISQRFSKVTASFLVVGSSVQEVARHIYPFIRHYPWSINRPYYEEVSRSIQGNSEQLVYGELEYEDMYEDEHLLTSLLIELSKTDCFVHVWNSEEYEPVLVYGGGNVDVLEGVSSLNRIWLNLGKVAVLNTHGAFDSNTKDSKKYLSMDRAIAQVLNKDFEFNEKLTRDLQIFLRPYLRTYKLEHVYDISTKLPSDIAQAFASNPWLIGKALCEWKPQDSSAMEQDDDSEIFEVTLSVNTSSLLNLSLITDGSLDANAVSEALKRGFRNLDTQVTTENKLHEDNSRTLLQKILLKQQRIPGYISPDDVALKEIMESLYEGDAELQKRSEEDASRLQEHFEEYLKIETRKAQETQNFTEEEEEYSSDDSLIQQFENNPELIDLVNFIYEDQHKKPRAHKYNDDSDYQSDGSSFQINLDPAGDDGDKIIDVDNEEDALVQDDEQEEKIGEKFEQVASDEDTESIYYRIGEIQIK